MLRIVSGVRSLECYSCVYIHNVESQESCSEPWSWYRDKFNVFSGPPKRECEHACMVRAFSGFWWIFFSRAFLFIFVTFVCLVSVSIENLICEQLLLIWATFCAKHSAYIFWTYVENLSFQKIVIAHEKEYPTVVRTCGKPCNETTSGSTTTTCCATELCNGATDALSKLKLLGAALLTQFLVSRHWLSG